MFGFFKKKPTALDALIKFTYGDQPPRKTAELGPAVFLAHEELMNSSVPREQVHKRASQLIAGPIPYSTHDLALSVAMAFYKDPAWQSALADHQLAARMRVLEWIQTGKVAKVIAGVFEETLYKAYKSVPAQVEQSSGDELNWLFAAFKAKNAGKSPQEAAKVLRDFMIWQHNHAGFEKSDEPTDEQFAHAEDIERAFLMGASSVGIEAFSLPEDTIELFILNFLGTYHGMGSPEAENEIFAMYQATEKHELAAKIGSAAIIHYLVHGKRDEDIGMLAQLQAECW